MMADTDVAVIGAGLAGLTAAAELAGRGHRVAVIEATERSGGRIATHAFGDVALDEGGAYVGPRHTAVRELAERNGVGLTPTEVPGDSLFDLRGTITRSPGPPPLNALALGDLLDRLEGLAEEVCLGCPAATAGAGRLDTLTVASWAAEQRLHPDARLALTLIVREMLAVEPTDVSLLHLLYYTRSGGGICYLTAFSGGAQQDRFTGGAARLTSQLTARLRVPPVLGAPVRSVSAGQDRVCLAGDDVRLTARHVLITVPSGTAEPLLVYGPGPISAGQRRVRGSAIKVHVIYPEPFWRAVGLSGWITSDSGPAGFFVDDAAWSAGPGVLTGFITGDAAGAYRGSSPGDRRAAVLTRLARWLGPAAAQPLRYCEHDWLARPFAPGCYGAVPTPGAWSTEQPLAAPGTRLHWAGSERSAEFYGHMEGAVRSGLRAADVIDSALRRQSRAGITY